MLIYFFGVFIFDQTRTLPVVQKEHDNSVYKSYLPKMALNRSSALEYSSEYLTANKTAYGWNSYCRGSGMGHIYQIILDKHILGQKNAKVWAFSSLCDAAVTKVLQRMYVFEQF